MERKRNRPTRETLDTSLTIKLKQPLKHDLEDVCDWMGVEVAPMLRSVLEDFAKTMKAEMMKEKHQTTSRSAH